MLALHRQADGCAAEYFRDGRGGFFEDFDGPTMPAGFRAVDEPWNLDIPSWGNCWNLPQNVTFADSCAIITAKAELNHVYREYTTGRIATAAALNFRRGLIEVNARMPYGQGVWPGLWMLPAKRKYGDWPVGGEIDILENPGPQGGCSATNYYSTLHWGGAPHITQSNLNTCPDMTAGFHTYWVNWQEGSISFGVDGFTRHTVNGGWYSDGGAYPAPFDVPFFLRMELQIGGEDTWSGAPNGSVQFPVTMEIDWVRYTPL